MINSKQIYKYTRDLNVLYIENNKTVRKDTLKIFKKFFKDITGAVDGKDGLEKYLKFYKKNDIYFDIVFTEVLIPNIGGNELIDKLYSFNPAQVIVVISNNQNNNTLIKLIDQGIVGFILKPIENDDLVKVLYKISNNISHGKITKKYATGMKKLNKILKERVKEEITKNNLKEIRLIEQKNALSKEQEIQKHKDIFLAKMSHDIRTPLNAIIGFAKILKNTSLTEEQLRYLDLINTSSHILSNIINDILDFSKIAEGKFELDLKPTNCKIEATTFLNIFKSQIKEKGLDFIINIDSNLPDCMIYDKNRLKQIVMNLIGNSIKFTNKGSIEFTEKLLSKTKTMATVRYSIKDTGIGIEKDKQEDIFKAFSQENKSISTKFGGTGLGVSIADELVKLYGSELKVTSKPNIGTEFYFTLDLEICDNSLLEEEEDESSDDESIFESSHILVAEDNLINQELIEHILNNKNIKTTITNNGNEVVDMYINNKDIFDVIFMDINMPIKGGVEALNTIREYEQNNNVKAIPIVALTANTIKGDEDKYIKLGMNDYLSKPIDIQKLNIVLSKYLNKNYLTKTENSQNINDSTSDLFAYDLQSVAKELEIDITLVQTLLIKFFDKFNSQIEEMEEAIRVKDFNKLYNILHAVKGTSGNLRLTHIEKIIHTLEKQTTMKNIDFQWSNHFESLRKYMQDYKNLIKELF